MGVALEANEMRRGWIRRQYALSLFISLRAEEEFVGEWLKARARVDTWVRRRGRRCKFVLLTVVCNPDFYGSVEQVLLHGDGDFASAVPAVPLHVVLSYGEGRIAKEFSVPRRSAADAATGALSAVGTPRLAALRLAEALQSDQLSLAAPVANSGRRSPRAGL